MKVTPMSTVAINTEEFSCIHCLFKDYLIFSLLKHNLFYKSRFSPKTTPTVYLPSRGIYLYTHLMKKQLRKISEKPTPSVAIDELAAMCMREFSAIRAVMVTKQDLENVRVELKEEIRKVNVRLDSVAVNHEHRIRTLEDRVIFS